MRKTPRTSEAVIGILVVLFLLNAETSVASGAETEPTQAASVIYTCPMDPEVRSESSGRCPKCGMDLRVADEPGTQAAAPALATRLDGSIAGLRVPDVPVVDQDGRRLRFFTDLVKGRTVAINFMFTTCTTICPPLAVTFAKVQQQLDSEVGKGILLISVSVDPVTDVPMRMKSYLSKFGARPGWFFVGGAKTDIDTLLRALGAYVSDKNDHTPMILIGNEKTGFWTRAFGLASASNLATVIIDAQKTYPAMR